MNKLLFNEGGQPVYLDDLEVMQSEPQNQLAALLEVLGARAGTYLLKEFSGKYLAKDDASGKTAYAVNENYLVKDGVIYDLPATSVLMADGDKLYVGLKAVDSNERDFDDGQSRACLRTTTGFYSTTKTDDGMLEVKSLKTIWELMAPAVKAATPADDYTDVNVSFENGYSGTVQYRDTGDAYRIKINIESKSAQWQTIDGSKDSSLFTYMIGSAPFRPTDFSMAVLYYAGELNNIEMKLHGHSGRMYLQGIDTESIGPLRCAIKTIIEIPK